MPQMRVSYPIAESLASALGAAINTAVPNQLVSRDFRATRLVSES